MGQEKKKLFYSGWPLIGGLSEAGLTDHKYAFIQLIIVTLFALFPTLLFTFWGFLFQEITVDNILLEAGETIKHGELFMVCTSLLGPVAYMAITEQGPNQEPLLNKTEFWIFTLIIIALSSVAYMATQKYADTVKNATMVSIIFLGMSLFLFYLANVYQNVRSPIVDLKRDAKKKSKEISRGW